MDELLKKYKFPIIGASIGFLLSVLFFTLGFFKTIFLILLMVLGAYIAYSLQKSGLFEELKK